MPEGLQIFDANGNTVVDLTTRLTRIITTINPNRVNGSASFPSVNNSIVGLLSIYQESPGTGGTGVLPQVTTSGNTVSWDFGGSETEPFRMHCRIHVIGY